jgi:hypothetical protein
MSLTSFVESTEVRRRFREEFEKPRMKAAPDLVVPPTTNRPSHVGTAFDYLLRFYARRFNPEVAQGRQWVAESALQLLSGAQKENAEEVVERAKDARDEYVATGDLTRNVLEAALHLARLDLVVRTRSSGGLDINAVDPIAEEDLDDLRRLHAAVPERHFRADTLCFLNPTFGKASALVGGADADLLVDDTLIEIKTVKEASFDREMFNQLLGYYTLHIIGGIGEVDPKPTIRRVAVYFSRHAYLHTVHLDEVVDRSTYPDFVEWFAREALKRRAASDRPG